MSKKSLVRSQFFKASVQPNGELVCYAAGYGSKIKHYRQATTALRKLGYDVLAFEYDEAVLKAGQPQLLIDVVNDVLAQAKRKAKGYKEVMCMGVSLGGFVGYHMLKYISNASVGAFADCGVDFVPAIFNSRIFKKVAAAYIANGYSPADLDRIWEPLDAQPAKATFPKNKSFIVYDGTTDKIVRFKEAKQNIEAWAAKGIRVRQYPVRRRGHLRTALYYIRHTADIVAEAKQYHAATA